MSDTNAFPDRKKPAWYRPTIEKYLFALFALEITLYASEQFRWFEFNRHKNWTVLINVAVVAIGLILISLWTAGAALLKRRPQFGLSTMMGLVFVVGLACGWLSREIANTRSQADIKKEFAELGLSTALDFVGGSISPAETLRWEGVQFIGLGLSVSYSTDAHTPPVLRKWFGNEFFSSIDSVTFRPTDEEEARRGFEALKAISGLRGLYMCGPHITDATLASLGELPRLESLTISQASISNDGLRHLSLLERLREIQLDGVSIDDAGLVYLEELRHLHTICVRRAPITDASVARMADMKALTLVHVEDTLVTDEGVSQLRSELPKCRILLVCGGKIKTMGASRR